MAYTVKQIAEALGAKALGALDIEITALAEPQDASATDLALATKPAYAEALGQGAARAAMLWEGADWQALGLEAAIIAPRPRYAMSHLTAMMDIGEGWGDGVHPTAVIHPEAKLAAGVHIGPLSVIGAGAEIGAGCRIGPQVSIGADARIAEDCLIREGVRIAARVKIGARVIINPGAVLGGDGFSFVTPEPSQVEHARASLGDQGDAAAQSYARIHSLGSVRIGDDVEIGANAAIDRGTIRDTIIGDRTKIDTLVMVAHNVVVGTDTLLCGLVGVAGSSRIGSNVVLGGQVGVGDNLFIGDNVICGGGTKVLSNIPAGRVMLGYPAMKMDAHVEMYKGMRRLSRLYKEVDRLKKAVFNQSASD
ncbi:UDP-3-O-(3-hydroxymyristoyl)glucosamine N-acyltransferase [Roseovarius sp. LXJ103]|uniref:UDP-3-O-(3-hydroxymyristoyl)glucosamine N-acyltransferase n=1 Tax=Roseovarius carneus TaxID=2853164 RepID=UPI000D61A44F|nr:UDP-3-O-(3-hydroxymyristoyl)glucosamine N-acyltransferase [Roseovarius carneus]MBZ8119410.1 UDP-3-O-(3-hydroxymyristoyl)glucosamine N-acyltransferase [Roseovarius carneus]PWE34946.1 UDP-3-O-(3-hydroxymyristoyl)glucosamine N-acyltransferase [Pelagicola sp. LXJ1103]